jgi:5'-AMP-activated protein kinase regulatory gamma subunit
LSHVFKVYCSLQFAPMTLSQLLNNATVADVLRCKPRERTGVVTLSHNTTVGEALATLAESKCLSAPILLEPDIEDSLDVDATPTLIGWLDLKDILAALMAFIESQNDERQLPTMMLSLMAELEKRGQDFLNRSLVCVPVREDRKLLPKDDAPETSLMTLIRECFIETAEEGREVNHRIALFDSHGEIVDVLSQSDVVSFIVGELGPGEIDGNLRKSLEELGLLQNGRSLVSVNAHEPMLAALAKMAKAGISGAPVVAADTGAIIANLSLSDLRALRSEHFGVLALPVAEFLALLHGTAYIGYSRMSSEHGNHPYFASQNSKTKKPTDIQVYAITRSTALIDTMRILSEHQLHRVYVCSQSVEGLKMVQAVVSLTDVLQYIAGVF